MALALASTAFGLPQCWRLEADGDRAGPEQRLLTRGDDPVQAARADHAARQALELGGHAVLKRGALGFALVGFDPGFQRGDVGRQHRARHENAKAVARAMAERDPEVRLH